jgi:hypothetical protein
MYADALPRQITIIQFCTVLHTHLSDTSNALHSCGGGGGNVPISDATPTTAIEGRLPKSKAVTTLTCFLSFNFLRLPRSSGDGHCLLCQSLTIDRKKGC